MPPTGTIPNQLLGSGRNAAAAAAEGQLEQQLGRTVRSRRRLSLSTNFGLHSRQRR